MLECAAEAAAWYSSAAASARVEVDYTRRRDVRKIPGGATGLVTYKNERTIRVEPRAPSGARPEPATPSRERGNLRAAPPEQATPSAGRSHEVANLLD